MSQPASGPAAQAAARTGMRVVVCDDHLVFREALAAYLLHQPGITSVSVAADADQAVRLVRSGADVFVLDLLLGADTSSLDALEALYNLHIRVPTLLMSAGEDADLIAQAITYGATGFCPKQAPPEVFVSALFGVARGEVLLPPGVVAPVTRSLIRARRTLRENENLRSRLTEREAEVLRLLAKGFGRDEIARQFGVSANTVRTHLRAIMQKLDVHSQVTAAALGRRIFGMAGEGAGRSSAGARAG